MSRAPRRASDTAARPDWHVDSAAAATADAPFSAAAERAALAWRFDPATRDGAPVAAVVRVELTFRAPAPPPPAPSPPPREIAPSPAPRRAPPPGSPPVVTEEVLVRGAHEPSRSASLSRAEVRQIPRTFGDPFRAIETMPGVTPIVSGLPFFFIRGAPPGDVGYFLDGIRIPGHGARERVLRHERRAERDPTDGERLRARDLPLGLARGDRGVQPTGGGGACGTSRFTPGTLGPDRSGGGGQGAQNAGDVRNAQALETRARGTAYGLEIFLKRRLTSRLGGFVSYTLSRSTRTANGQDFVASFDRTQVLNAAVAFDLGRRWRAGTRVMFYTGLPKAPDPTDPGATRLAPFFRLALRLDELETSSPGRCAAAPSG